MSNICKIEEKEREEEKTSTKQKLEIKIGGFLTCK